MGRWVVGIIVAVGFAAAAGRLARAEEPPSAPAQTGTISGTVTDKGSGSPIIEAGVEVVGRDLKVRTDLDGKFKLRVPPGTYELRIFAPLYQAIRLQKVVVKPNQVANASASLAAAKAGVEVVEVVAQADKAAEATQLLKRRSSPVVEETVSAEAIKKTPDSNAAEVVQRVPAVTIKNDKFVFVRGLNERYSSALLNESRLPSTDPERRVVPLDLFPSDFIESLAVIKSYNADLPGDFSGGLVDIHLREFPEKLSYGVTIGTSGNTQATGQPFNTYLSGNWDRIAAGGGFRALPSDVPTAKMDNASPQRFSIGHSFKDIWSPESVTAPTNTGINFSIGDTIGNLGLSFGGLWSNEYKNRFELDNNYVAGGTVGTESPTIHLADNFRYNNSVMEVHVGGLMTAAYRFGTDHKITLRGFLDRNAFDQVLVGEGITDQFRNLEQQTQFRYTVEQLALGQLQGEHHILPWLDADWRTAFSRTTQDVPDNRYTTYIQTGAPGTPLQFSNDSLGGSRIFQNLGENLTDSAVDFTVPFLTGLPFTDVWDGLAAKLKFGPAYSYRFRNFQQRRFRYRVINNQAVDLTLPPEQLLAPDNVAPGLIDFIEETVPRDTFMASQEIAGIYGLVELPIIQDRLRFVGGARGEYSYIVLHTFDDQGNPAKPIKNNLDPLPSLALIYSPQPDMNFRLSWSKTVTRPEFRELSPALINQPRGLRPFFGNPNLVETHITNLDLRWEWFFSPLELLSMGLFEKQLDQPIEATVVAVGSGRPADSADNADHGELWGLEWEGRKHFGFIGPRWRNLSIIANVAYIQSTVTVPRGQAQVQTNTERPLQGQAPYIVNAALDYTDPLWGTARLLYNTAGPSVYRAGTFGLPDIFLEPRNEIDLVFIVPLERFIHYPLTAKLAAENLLNDQVVTTQGGEVVQRYTSGVKIGLALTYAF